MAQAPAETDAQYAARVLPEPLSRCFRATTVDGADMDGKLTMTGELHTAFDCFIPTTTAATMTEFEQVDGRSDVSWDGEYITVMQVEIDADSVSLQTHSLTGHPMNDMVFYDTVAMRDRGQIVRLEERTRLANERERVAMEQYIADHADNTQVGLEDGLVDQ